MNLSPSRDDAVPSASAANIEALEVLLRFGSQMLRAGDTAYRVRRWMGISGRALGFEALEVHIGLGSIIVSGLRGGEWTTLVREVGSPGVNTTTIGALEELASTMPLGFSPRDFATRLVAIEATPPLYSIAQTGAAVGIACGAFTFLNGGAEFEMATATVGGFIGQCLRAILFSHKFNQYAITTLCALVASGVSFLISALSIYLGFGITHYTVGFISSVLFLVPGFRWSPPCWICCRTKRTTP